MGREEMAKIAEAVNILGKFCGPRDIEELTTAALQDKYHFSRVDVAVLFGGSILAGGEVFAEIMKNRLAEKYVIVGGAGHTTETLREKMAASLGREVSSNSCEAKLFNEYLQKSMACRQIIWRRNPPTVAITSPFCLLYGKGKIFPMTAC